MSTPRFRLCAVMNFLLICLMYRSVFTLTGCPSASANQSRRHGGYLLGLSHLTKLHAGPN